MSGVPLPNILVPSLFHPLLSATLQPASIPVSATAQVKGLCRWTTASALAREKEVQLHRVLPIVNGRFAVEQSTIFVADLPIGRSYFVSQKDISKGRFSLLDLQPETRDCCKPPTNPLVSEEAETTALRYPMIHQVSLGKKRGTKIF